MKLTAADKAWALAVKERDHFTCRRCLQVPDRRGLHAHHIFTRSRRQTRHVVENGISLCYGDHRWAHSNPLEFHEWMREMMGWKDYDALRLRSNKTKVSA